MNVNAVTHKRDIIKVLGRCWRPQRYLNEGSYIIPKKVLSAPVKELKQADEYFSPFASTGIKINTKV